MQSHDLQHSFFWGGGYFYIRENLVLYNPKPKAWPVSAIACQANTNASQELPLELTL